MIHTTAVMNNSGMEEWEYIHTYMDKYPIKWHKYIVQNIGIQKWHWVYCMLFSH